ncbi:MAG TPA: hypothetical protein VND40_06005 [Nitrososphaerales archaeon]|nr:hypothetical protein [Nitrososphaerales archaeon]
MTPARELDSLPHSEAQAVPESQATPSSLPGWERCDVHRVSFLFECGLCAGAVLGYGC